MLAPCQVMGYVFAKTVDLKRIWILLKLDIANFSLTEGHELEFGG